MSEIKENLYDTQEEVDRNKSLEDSFCSKEEWKKHPDNRFTYEQLFIRFKCINFKILTPFEIRDEFYISFSKSIYGPRLINDFISNGLIKQLDLAYVYYSTNFGDF